jgi:hypothetical protein
MVTNKRMNNNQFIGVLGDQPDNRSSRDRQIQRKFCSCKNIEPFVSSGIGITMTRQDLYPRSQMDIMMQKEFNPYFKNQTQECYCGSNPPNNNLPSWYASNPYIQESPQTGKITYAPLR